MNWKGYGRLFLHAGITGAVTSVASATLTPDFEGKANAVLSIGAIGAIRAIADLLHKNPLDPCLPKPASKARIPKDREK